MAATTIIVIDDKEVYPLTDFELAKALSIRMDQIVGSNNGFVVVDLSSVEKETEEAILALRELEEGVSPLIIVRDQQEFDINYLYSLRSKWQDR